MSVTIVSYLLIKNQQDALLLGVIAGLTFMLLDYFIPVVGNLARKGVGLGFGLMMVGGAENPKTEREERDDKVLRNEFKMIPTCPDPNNSGKALLAGYIEPAMPFNGSTGSVWPFEAYKPVPYGSCDMTGGDTSLTVTTTPPTPTVTPPVPAVTQSQKPTQMDMLLAFMTPQPPPYITINNVIGILHDQTATLLENRQTDVILSKDKQGKIIFGSLENPLSLLQIAFTGARRTQASQLNYKEPIIFTHSVYSAGHIVRRFLKEENGQIVSSKSTSNFSIVNVASSDNTSAIKSQDIVCILCLIKITSNMI
jgi:hypothetical protein